MTLVCTECDCEYRRDESPSDELCVYCWSAECDQETG